MQLKHAIAAILLANVLSVALAACQAIKNSYLNLKPPPEMVNPMLTASRVKAQQDIIASFATIEARTSLVSHAAFAAHDFCEKGPNNIEVKGGLAHRCSLRITRFYGMDGDFRSRMLDFEGQLSAEQWQIPNFGMQQVMTDYYDTRMGKVMQSEFDETRTRVLKRKFQVSDLPIPREGYNRANLKLWVRYLEAPSTRPALDTLAFQQYVDPLSNFSSYEVKEFPDVRAIFQELTQTHRYVLSVSIQGKYFES